MWYDAVNNISFPECEKIISAHFRETNTACTFAANAFELMFFCSSQCGGCSFSISILFLLCNNLIINANEIPPSVFISETEVDLDKMWEKNA